jgi:four helix bundle protein
MPYNDFTEMPVWQKADEIVGEVYKLTEILPKREDYALCSQLRDAAISIAGNIAEGFGRGHKKDKINFYFYSRGSCFEVRSHLYSGKTAGYFSNEQIKAIGEKCMKVVEELNKIIKGLGNSDAILTSILISIR